MIAHSLDSIAAAADGEGQALLRRAARFSPRDDHKIIITPGQSTTYHQNEGTLPFNFLHLATTRYRNGDRQHNFSVTGWLVHEFYHLADSAIMKPETLLRSYEEALTPLLLEHGFSEGEAKEAIRLLWDFRERPGEYKPTQPLLSRLWRKTSDGEINAALKHAGLIGEIKEETGIEIQEINATAYTDAFMEKNFGTQEPPRRRYRNVEPANERVKEAWLRGRSLDESMLDFPLTELKLPTLLEVPYPTSGFTPIIPKGATLPNPLRIAPVPASRQ